MRPTCMVFGCLGCLLAFFASAESKIWLDELDLTPMVCGKGEPQKNASLNGNKIRAGRKRFQRGVGTHAESFLLVETGGNALAFEASVAVDDEEVNQHHGSVSFLLFADGKCIADSGRMVSRKKPVKLSVSLTGVQRLLLAVTHGGDGIDGDHADWCDAFFTVKDNAKLKTIPLPPTPQLGILTPPTSPLPRINGASRFGVRPGNPLLFTLPVTGENPIAITVSALPQGVHFDPQTRQLSGKINRPGTYPIHFTAKNKQGQCKKTITIIAGEKLSLTPPMGWNSWNCFAATVSDHKIREAADAMVNSGLINHGWSYINIDDFWQHCPSERNDPSLQGKERDEKGMIRPNKRFPDLAGLTEYVHKKGLKIGIYSSPGPLTCGGCTGSWKHEALDAQTYAAWGFDYLKYDWCSYSSVNRKTDLKNLMKPFLLMGQELKKQNRDILFSICQYGMGNVPTWGARVGGNCWRTTDDIRDTWESVSTILDQQDGYDLFVEPGAWNDPDMLVVGRLGWGELRPSRLTPNEQYTHVSLWCLLAAPLMIGCDLTALDPFTRNLLTNDEVIETNQDPAGHCAVRILRDDFGEVWAKKMSDGSIAAALVNRFPFERAITLPFKTMAISTPCRLRDLWRQKDLGVAENAYSVSLPGHATQLIRIFPENATLP